jgi:hypothetical protein
LKTADCFQSADLSLEIFHFAAARLLYEECAYGRYDIRDGCFAREFARFMLFCAHGFPFVMCVKPANDPSSATRRTGRNDCNRDAPAGFAAAHG